MRKSLVSILLLSLMLSGCNLPFPTQTAVPTPTVDILATQVSCALPPRRTPQKALRRQPFRSWPAHHLTCLPLRLPTATPLPPQNAGPH